MNLKEEVEILRQKFNLLVEMVENNEKLIKLLNEKINNQNQAMDVFMGTQISKLVDKLCELEGEE